jgi:hypothetical protein
MAYPIVINACGMKTHLNDYRIEESWQKEEGGRALGRLVVMVLCIGGFTLHSVAYVKYSVHPVFARSHVQYVRNHICNIDSILEWCNGKTTVKFGSVTCHRLHMSSSSQPKRPLEELAHVNSPVSFFYTAWLGGKTSGKSSSVEPN